jgi:hypothetical protein
MQVRGIFGEGQIIAPPHVAVLALPVASVVVCPVALQDAVRDVRGMQEIYRLAYEQACAALRPSWYEQLLRASRN